MTQSLEILLVEDNDGDVEMTQRALRNNVPECNLSVANDGVEAMDLLHKRGQFTNAPTPQIILLDLNMPRMDGIRFLEQAKADAVLKSIPVIVFTSSQSQRDIQECYEHQASCYIVKPFDGKEFANAVQQVASFWGNLGQLPEKKHIGWYGNE